MAEREHCWRWLVDAVRGGLLWDAIKWLADGWSAPAMSGFFGLLAWIKSLPPPPTLSWVMWGIGAVWAVFVFVHRRRQRKGAAAAVSGDARQLLVYAARRGQQIVSTGVGVGLQDGTQFAVVGGPGFPAKRAAVRELWKSALIQGDGAAGLWQGVYRVSDLGFWVVGRLSREEETKWWDGR